MQRLSQLFRRIPKKILSIIATRLQFQYAEGVWVPVTATERSSKIRSKEEFARDPVNSASYQFGNNRLRSTRLNRSRPTTAELIRSHAVPSVFEFSNRFLEFEKFRDLEPNVTELSRLLPSS